jgi:hypothetical protein
MIQLLDIWGDILISDDLPTALDGGVPAVIRLLGRAADAWLRTVSPPYSAAVSVCESSAGESIQCGEKLEAFRDEVLTGIAKISGVYHLIEIIVDAWNALPQSVRDAVHAAMKAGEAWKNLLENPNLATIWAAGIATFNAVKELVTGLLVDIWNGDVKCEDFIDWADSFGTESSEIAASILDKAGLHIAADVVRTIGGTVSSLQLEVLRNAAGGLDTMIEGIRSGDPEQVVEGFTEYQQSLQDLSTSGLAVGLVPATGIGMAVDAGLGAFGINNPIPGITTSLPVVGPVVEAVSDIPVVGDVVCLGGLLC